MTLPLESVRVLDLTIWQQGPYASAMLADMGADVVKVEGPDAPDPGRGLLAQGNGPNPYFESHNRNKRGVVMDLKSARGREVFQRLAATADVVVQNFRRGVAQRLGVDYPTLAGINPRLIYASASGFGRQGPDSERPALDILAQARGGLMSVTGEPESPPTRTFPGFADQVSAFLLAFGIMVALWHRERSGQGQEVTSSLLGAALFAQTFNITSFLMGMGYAGSPIPRVSRKLTSPLWNHYQGKDGRWFVFGMTQMERYWPVFRRALEEAAGELVGPEELSIDYMRQHLHEVAALIARLDEIFLQRPAVEWVSHFRRYDLLVELVQTYGEVVRDPQVGANDMIVDFPHPAHGPVRMVGVAVGLGETPGRLRRPAPEFGQHTEEVLLEYGFTWEEIEALNREGAIGLGGAGARLAES
ncbi:MAG: CaiB/BaiF CoA transferase family protein [Dehalococcoidia bacterium]